MFQRFLRNNPLRVSAALGVSCFALNTLMSPLKVAMSSAPDKNVLDWINRSVNNSSFIVFAKTTCPYCSKLYKELKDKNYRFSYVPIDQLHKNFPHLPKADYLSQVQTALSQLSNIRTVPQVFVNGKFVGGCSDTLEKEASGELKEEIEKREYDYDLVIIGGGSGGLAMSKQAAKMGAKVAVLDHVEPSPMGSKWGLGGTCVNVGCIPKKLMHQSAIIKHTMEDAEHYGWNVNASSLKHDWSTLVSNVQNYIKSLNFGYRTSLKSNNVDYINSKGTLIDKNTVLCKSSSEEKTLTTKHVCIAVGERPRYLNIPNAKETCITSDDLFSLKREPGKTLVVGASYVALECAGFMAALGYDVTVMVRSILLRGFDQQIANMIGNYMENHGVKFIHEATPSKISKLDDGQIEVESTKNDKSIVKDVYNTVILAVGRDPCTRDLNLEKVGVKVDKDYRIIVDDNDGTSVDNIYAIGDIASGKPQLTPVAIEAGYLLANRLYGASNVKTEYDDVATTVFTPLEYGACGLSEEDAMSKYNPDDIEVYHTYFKPLEWTIAEREDNVCYAKIICLKKHNSELVIGIHILSPNAGEVIQGYALALKLKATKADIDRMIGIHPTIAEIFTTMETTKRSGESAEKAGC